MENRPEHEAPCSEALRLAFADPIAAEIADPGAGGVKEPGLTLVVETVGLCYTPESITRALSITVSEIGALTEGGGVLALPAEDGVMAYGGRVPGGGHGAS